MTIAVMLKGEAMRPIDADAIPYTMIYRENWMRGTGGEEQAAWKSAIDAMPTIEPERKKGKWINNVHDIAICNQCGYMTPYDRAIDDYEYGNFCPNCGADMRGGQE